MSDPSTNPAEKPVNDGGGSAPQADSEPTQEQEAQATEESGSD
jgi:hypothetical protein